MISKQKKLVEKPKKSAPKKKVKNVNIDKIVKIIKRFITKCGMKKQLKGGTPYSFLKGLVKGKDELDVSTCFQNLKDLDETFSKIKEGIIASKKNLVTNIKLLISKREKELDENNKQSTELADTQLDPQDIQLTEYTQSTESVAVTPANDQKGAKELSLTHSIKSLKFVEQLLNNAGKEIYNNSEIKLRTEDIESLMDEDNNTLIIISALNIARALFEFRLLMLQCVNIEIKKSDPEKKKEMQEKIDKHIDSSKDYFNE
jgi:hypothetical protein